MSESSRFQRSAGDRIGPWRLVAPLGRGGYSEVWRARHHESSPETPSADVALKLITRPELVATLRVEAETLALVRGRGVVRTYEADLTSSPPYLALELVTGGDLRRRLSPHSDELRRSPGVALRTTEEILEILVRLHREGVVHGDLKPENVLFDGFGQAKLADFGLSRRIGQQTATLSVSLSQLDARLQGTLDYMAPEQRAGERASPASDVYAVGVMLHEMLTGQRPQGVRRAPGESDQRLPRFVDETLRHALAASPADRFPNARAMLQFLRLGLWLEGTQLRAASAALDEKLQLADFGVTASFGLGLLFATIAATPGMHDLVSPVKTLDVRTATAALVLAVVPAGISLLHWKHRAGREAATTDAQIRTLQSWRLIPESAAEVWPPEVVARRARRAHPAVWFARHGRLAWHRLRRLWRRAARRGAYRPPSSPS